MDVFAHGFWAAAAATAANRKLAIRVPLPWAALWGVFPDLFAFTPTFFFMLWLRFVEGVPTEGRFFIFSARLRDSLPVFLKPDELYHYSHSLVIFALVFAIVWRLRHSPSLVMLGWPLHILLDIPTHRAGRYGTPFLWPLTDYRFDGISWGQPWFMLLNWSAIATVYLCLFLWSIAERRRSKSRQPVAR